MVQVVTRRTSQRSRRRWLICAVVVAALVALIASSVDNIARWEASRAADGEARDAMVAVYAEQLRQHTDGAIVIDVLKGDNDHVNKYAWSYGSHTLTVYFSIVSCSGFSGTFSGVPNRPTKVEELGEMYFNLPSLGRYTQAARVSVEDPALYDKMLHSTLAHCIAGDKRLRQDTQTTIG